MSRAASNQASNSRPHNWAHLPLLISPEFEFGSSTDSSFVGAKAAGLLRLPRAWVPPFISFTTSFYDSSKGEDLYAAVQSLLEQNHHAIDALAPKGRLLVRSNNLSETMKERGSSQSVVVEASVIALAREVYYRIYRKKDELPIIQAVVEPGLLGHMSNERRVSSGPVTWFIEFGSPTKSLRIRAGKGGGDGPLNAATERDLLFCLRQVAGFLSSGEERFHCEWIWDGERVWIVQADMAQESVDEEVFLHWLTSNTENLPLPSSGLRIIRHFLSEDVDEWHKLRCPLLFHRLGLPSADIFLLTGERWSESSASGHLDLLEDLRSFRGAEIIIRCDISHESRDRELLLPISTPTRSIEGMIDFMVDASSRLRAHNLADNQWAFLLNVLVSSKVGAFIRAFPDSTRVHIDALWGSPDGLSYFPHDSYFYCSGSRQVSARARYKGLALLPTPSWRPVSVPPPYDWKRVLSDSEVIQLGEWGLSVAKEVGCEIQLMSLVRIDGRRGPEACLPWHFTTLSVPAHNKGYTSIRPRGGAFRVIANYHDLDALVATGDREEVRGLLVRPDSELIRESDFLRKVGSVASLKQIPVYFEGSVLGHAYYILSNSGAFIVPISPDRGRPKESPARHNKLVRDHIPAIIQRAGGIARVRSIARTEAKTLLLQKIIEEAFELWDCPDRNLREELADLLEVIGSLRKHLGIAVDDLEELMSAKRRERGGFDNLILLEETVGRTLDDTEEAKGLLPLFYGDAQLPASKEPSIVMIQTPSNWEILRFKLPLVPPVHRGQRLSRVWTMFRDLVVSATYRGSELEIDVSKLETENDRQLVLFPELIRPARAKSQV